MSLDLNSQPPSRPTQVEDLLREPIVEAISAGATVPIGECYRDWDRDHGERTQFYVSGYLEFLRTRAVKDTKQLYERFADEALSAVPTEWKRTIGKGNVWQEIAQNQFRAARNGKAIYVQKAAIVLLAAEHAVDAALKSGRNLAKFKAGADVYKVLRIVPACYNIDGFNENFLARLNESTIKSIADKAKQPVALLHDLARRQTVTAATAISVLEAASSFGPIGPARGRPGRNLGTKSASENELLDLG